jgi:hypothetical protein
LSRSKQLLESEGWLVDIVERRITSMITKDLFGFIDLLAIKDGVTLGVQVPSGSNVAARIKKILASDAFPRVAATFRLEVHGWVVTKRRPTRVRRVPVEEAPVISG